LKTSKYIIKYNEERSTMKPIVYSTERGQALILIAFAAIGLFAIVGLAIDGSAKLSDRRQAQNAADSAVLAGALANLRADPNWELAALDKALENGYDDNHLTNEVEVHACDDVDSSCGPYAGDPLYVQVIITSHINTTFARVIGFNELTNTVRSVAMSQEGYWGELYGGGAVIGLAPDQCKTIWLSGSAAVNITGGGIFSNSNVDCGVTIQGANGFDIDMDGRIEMVAPAYTKHGNPDLSRIGGGLHGSADPYQYPPPAGLLPKYTCDWTYSNFPPSGVTNLDPGVYCVTNRFKLNSGDVLTGSGVTIVMEDGDIDWNGHATINLSAPTEGDLAGLLIYAPMSNHNTMRFNGNASSNLTGTIFMPAAPLVYNGTGNLNPSRVQIIGYTVELTGSNDTNVLYQDADNWDANLPAQVGLMQ
jgi:hypothetical protein